MTEGPGRPRRWGRIAAAAVVLLLLVSSTWWTRALAERMAFFRVRKVEIEGARYVDPAELLARLRVDTAASVWAPVTPLERRVAAHPQVRSVRVERKLPGTLVVRVEEHLPVALAPARGGLRAYDAEGRLLPLDPSKVTVDVPLVSAPDSAVLRLLGQVRVSDPALYARISEVRRVGRGEIVVALDRWPVRAMADVTARRLAEIYPVEDDLARRRARVAELDLRFRDQVIARLQ